MSVINEVCGNVTTAGPQNMGGKDQCLEAPVKTIVLAKENFTFADLATAKTESAWDAAIVNKDIVPFPNIEGIELANTDAVTKEGRYRDYELVPAVPGVQYRFDLSVCTYADLVTYKNSEYTRVFEITNSEEITCDVQTDGTVRGRDLTSFLIGLRNQATDDDVPYVNVNLKFNSDIFSIIKPETGFTPTTLEGIYDVALEVIGTPTATTIVVQASTACTGSLVTTLELDDWTFLKDSDGLEEAVTASSYNATTGYYTLTGSAFEDGMLSTGVISQPSIIYEAEPVAVTI